MSTKEQKQEAFASAIIQHRELFDNLYGCMRRAADLATRSDAVKNSRNNICVSPVLENFKRDLIPLCLKTKEPVVSFLPNALTLIGGSAVHLYNRAAEDIIHLNYAVHTTDIDAVWWPTIRLPNNIQQLVQEDADVLKHYEHSYMWTAKKTHPGVGASEFVVVSSSPAIETLVREFAAFLQSELEVFMTHYTPQLEAVCRLVFGRTYKLTFSTKIDHFFKNGAWNVQAILSTGSRTAFGSIKLIEIAVHDGASSQIQMANHLRPATEDPIYSSMGDVFMLRHRSMVYPVPRVDRLFQQLFFALKVRFGQYSAPSLSETKRRELAKKLEHNYRRCHYLLFGLMNTAVFIPQYKDMLVRVVGHSLTMQMMHQFYYDLKQSIEWVATCPDSLSFCQIQTTDPLFREACSKGMMMKRELCSATSVPVAPVAPVASTPVASTTHIFVPLQSFLQGTATIPPMAVAATPMATGLATPLLQTPPTVYPQYMQQPQYMQPPQQYVQPYQQQYMQSPQYMQQYQQQPNLHIHNARRFQTRSITPIGKPKRSTTRRRTRRSI